MNRRESMLLLASSGAPAAAFAFQVASAKKPHVPAALPPPPVRHRPRPLFNGGPVLFESHEPRPHATWMGKRLEFRKDGERYTALAAVPLDTKPSRYPLKWQVDGEEPASMLVTVTARQYPVSRITVAPKFVQPPPEVSKRIEEEQKIKKRVFSSFSMDERFWKGKFHAPSRAGYTGPFGSRRLYNGKTNSIHQGLDFGCPTGSQIEAANAGRVVISQEMYYEGGFVVIDHGEGVFTLYMHLSEFLVKEGAMVDKAQPIAKSGSSGRVTGPHLHFGVQWQGSYLEPGTLLQL